MKAFGIKRLIPFGPGLFRFFSNRGIGLGSKLLVIAALLYIVVPFDFFPDFVPVLGWLEDMIIALLTYSFVNQKVTSTPIVAKNKDVDAIPVDARVIEDED